MKAQLKMVNSIIETPIAPLPQELYLPTLKQALVEDLGLAGDVTSQLTIPENKKATATLVARADGIIAGLDIALTTFTLVDNSLQITPLITDGQFVKAGQKLATVKGNARAILTGERVALNLLSHLSGIATTTYKMANAIADLPTKLLDTRKTTPTLRALQKYAVRCGGGHNHRMSLADMVMIKDNHIAFAGGLQQALQAAKAGRSHALKTEVEVDTLQQLEELIALGGADIVLLDNMPPEILKKAVAMVNGKMATEASGVITPQTIRKIAETGVDYISAGFITHSAPAFDVGLDVI